MVLVLILLISVLFSTGCAQTAEANDRQLVLNITTEGCVQTAETNDQRLVLNVTTEEGVYRKISPEDLAYNYDANLSYYGVTDVMIQLNGQNYPLEESISSGLITVEEIVSFAQIDARNGICKLISNSKNGLTTFVYRYDGICDIRVRHDLYETPDGQQHLIKEVSIHNWNGTNTRSSIYTADDGSVLDMEDWGLEFLIMDQSSDGLTLNIKQAGGQHFGVLQSNSYSLFYLDGQTNVYSDDNNSINSKIAETAIIINNDDITTIEFDWADNYRNLPSGNYYLVLDIEDVYDPDAIHPLTRNFHDLQCYTIPFLIS